MQAYHHVRNSYVIIPSSPPAAWQPLFPYDAWFSYNSGKLQVAIKFMEIPKTVLRTSRLVFRTLRGAQLSRSQQGQRRLSPITNQLTNGYNRCIKILS